MPEIYRTENGLLRTEDSELRLSFNLEISQFGDLLIQFDALTTSKCSSFWDDFTLLSKLHRGSDRRIPFFHLSGATSGGEKISTEYATIRSLQPTFNMDGQQDSRLVFSGSASDLTIQHRSHPPNDRVSSCQVDYYTRAQMGFHVVSVETRHGTLSARGSRELQDHADKFGVLSIGACDIIVDDEWLESCDNLAKRALQLLSLGQGRTLSWSKRSLYFHDELISERFRPTKLQEATLAAAFSHLNLKPVLELLPDRFTQEIAKITGLDVALSWMLSSAPSIEGKYLNLLIALEHLISKFRSRSKPILPSSEYKSKILAPLSKCLDRIPDGNISSSNAKEIFQGKLSSLNAPPFYSCIQQIVETYAVPIDDLEESLKFSLVNCRNDLVHRGSLQVLDHEVDEIYHHFDVTEEFMKRLVLAMLKYEGSYISPLHNLDHYIFGNGKAKPANPPRSSE